MRSKLFVPSSRPELFPKALPSEAGARHGGVEVEGLELEVHGATTVGVRAPDLSPMNGAKTVQFADSREHPRRRADRHVAARTARESRA